MCVCVCARVRTCVRACMCASVFLCTHARQCVCMCVCARARDRAFVYIASERDRVQENNVNENFFSRELINCLCSALAIIGTKLSECCGKEDNHITQRKTKS